MAPDPIPMEPVMAAAGQDQLGALLDSTPRDDQRIFTRASAHQVHRFEHGLVVDTKKRGPLTLPYRDLRIYRDVGLEQKGYWCTYWRFERSDGQAWTSVTHHSRSGKRDASARAQFYEELLMTTCARQRDAALQRLAEGATLAFGPVELDRSQLTFGYAQTVAWARVTQLEVKDGKLMVQATRDGRFVKYALHTAGKVGKIANFPLLWELAHVAQRQAVGGG